MKKNKVLDLLLLALIYVAISSFPVELLFKTDETISTIIRIGLQACYLVFILLYLSKVKILESSKKHTKFPLIFVFLPLLLACVSNYFYIAFFPSDFSLNFSYIFFVECGLYLLVAINEEIIFRHLLLGNIQCENKLLKIVISAGIFGAFHITQFLSTFNPSTLITIVYTFILGIALGFIYEYAHSIEGCIILHFMFNALNLSLFNLGCTNISNYLMYIVINGSVVIVLGVYLLILYIKKFRIAEYNAE